jgi:hypothetical protein
MLSSRLVVHADIFTETHRLSGRIVCGPSGLIGLLNDVTTSLVELEDAYFSRLQQPAKIITHFDQAHLNKAHLSLIVLARREDLGPHGLATGGFARRIPIPVLVTTSGYEVQGTIEVVNKYDAAELLVGGTGRFVQLYTATAVATLFPDLSYSGAVILVNRQMIELVSPIPRSKA